MFKAAAVVSLSVAEAVNTFADWALQAQGLLVYHVDKHLERLYKQVL